MSIAAVCPHCDSVYQLSDDLAGKPMRCPNPGCREVFSVPSAPAEAPPAARGGSGTTEHVLMPEAQAGRTLAATDLPYQRVEDPPAVPYELDIVEDDAQPFVLETALEPEPAAPPRPRAAEPPAAPARAPRRGPVPVAEFARPKRPADDGPREVVWSGAEPPAGPPAARPAAFVPFADEEPADDIPFVRRKRPNPWPRRLLVGLAVSILAAGGTALGLYLQYQAKSEDRNADAAKTTYDGGNFAAAKTQYDGLLAEFPDSPRGDEYRFFAALAGVRAAAESVTARENPAPGVGAVGEFVGAFGSSPFAQPDTGYGADLVTAGRKLAEAIAGNGDDHLAAFRRDRAKADELEAARKAAADGNALLDSLERFRGKDAPGFDDGRKRLGGVADGVRREDDRLAVLAPFRDLAADPTGPAIETYEDTLRRTGLADDAEAKGIAAAAKGKLRELVDRFTPDGRAAAAVPADLAVPILFSAPVAGTPEPRPPADAPPDVVFGEARGVLYALDAGIGRLLWGTRVGPAGGDPRPAALPVRYAPPDGGPELVLVVSEVGGRAGLTARAARTGEPVWHQRFPAAVVGRPAVVGRRAYVPLADPLGTVVEVRLTDGAEVGHLQIRQPVGAGPAAVAGPGVGGGFVFVPADAGRVFVFEVGRESDAGERLPPRCVRVVPTDHPRNSLRGEPVVVAAPTGGGGRFLLIAQADGPAATKLRCFPLPPPAELAGAGGPTAETPPFAAEVAVPGWAWFPPVSDGERVLVATDAGAVGVFGVTQTGTPDAPLFTVPAPSPGGPAGRVARGAVVAADEDAAWAVVGGDLVRLRTAVDPAGGLRVVRHGTPRPVGEPAYPPDARPGLDLGVVTVRPPGPTGAVRAVGFDLRTGAVRWQRQLGAVAAGAPVARAGGPAVLADEEGGLYLLPDAAAGPSVVAAVLAPPAAEPDGRVQVAATPDGAGVWVLGPERSHDGRRLRIRGVKNGSLVTDASVPLPDAPAGVPVALGADVVFPLGNGFLYRLTPGGTDVVQGPQWRGAGGADAVCHLAPLGDDGLLATDGGVDVFRWRWPAGGRAERTATPWRTQKPVALPPAVFAAEAGPRFAAADAGGTLAVFNPDRPGEPVMRWHAGAGNVPAGVPSLRLEAVTVGGQPRLLYAADGRRLVCLDPDHPDPVWVASGLVPDDGPQVLGWQMDGGRVVVTDQTGRVLTLDAATGAVLDDRPPPAGGLAARPAAPRGDGWAVVPLADGTAARVPLSAITPTKKEP